MNTRNLSGIVPPVCTPLTSDLDVDVRSLERLVHFLLDAGVQGLFALGSTGEAAFLPDRLRDRVLEVVVSTVSGQVPVLAGAIDMTTLRVLSHVRSAKQAGVDGVVVTAPFYTRTHPAEIEYHFRTIADATDLPLYAYDLPVSVHSKLDPDLTLRLAQDGVLHGLKDSSGDDPALRGLLVEKRRRDIADFRVFTGSETTVDNAFRMGVNGAVPGLANVDPHSYVELANVARDGEWEAAAAAQERLLALAGLMSVGDSARIGASSSALGAFKAALHLRGIIDCPSTAAPQLPLEEHEVRQVRLYLAAAGLL